jgi:hypothetical protein
VLAGCFLTACDQETGRSKVPCPPPGSGGLVIGDCEPGGSASGLSPASGSQQNGFIVLTALDRTGDSKRPLALSPARRVIFESGILAGMASELNAMLDIRQPIFVDVRSCGVANAFYDPATGRITICDEFLYSVGGVFSDLPPERFQGAVLYVIGFTFLHEAGHALFDKLELRMTGKEEDVADQFAAYLLANSPEAQKVALAGAAYFGANFRARPNQLPLSWDTHSLDPQRFYNINCWVLGSDPARYAHMVGQGIVPPGRAASCQEEFQKFSIAFSEWLEPHRR